MSTILALLISSLFWTYVVASSPVLFVVAVVIFIATFPFDRRRRLLHLFSSFWAYHYVWLMPLWKVSFEGRRHIDFSHDLVHAGVRFTNPRAAKSCGCGASFAL